MVDFIAAFLLFSFQFKEGTVSDGPAPGLSEGVPIAFDLLAHAAPCTSDATTRGNSIVYMRCANASTSRRPPGRYHCAVQLRAPSTVWRTSTASVSTKPCAAASLIGTIHKAS